MLLIALINDMKEGTQGVMLNEVLVIQNLNL